MKKRRLPCFLLTFAMLLTIVVPAGDPVYAASDPANYIFDISEGSIIISPGADPAATVRVAYGAGQLTEEFSNSQNITIVGTAFDKQILVNGATANITLNNASITDYMGTYACVFDMTSGSRVNLTLASGSHNILTSEERNAALRVPVGAVLTIQGTGGFLNATGGPGIDTDPGGAGIGGSRAEIYGVINILGGTITAKGGQYAAGIGGGYAASSGTANSGIINISGDAIVTATSGIESAGIGGGYLRPGGTINISGNARVTAAGNYQGAGIGGCYASAGTITISDSASVTVTGGSYGAGIGGGYSGSGGTINIKDNTIISAAGGSNGAGIGGGYSGAGGSISISGGVLTVKGGQYAAGMGGGTGGSGGTIHISGLADVTVTGGGIEGAGIGGGSNGAYNTVPVGAGAVIIIDAPAVVKAAAIGITQPAIHALGGTLNPAGTGQVLMANFTSVQTAASNISVFDKSAMSLTASFTPASAYQSIAFTVPNAPSTYLLKSDGIKQQHSVSLISDFDIPASGLTLFGLVEDVLFSSIEIAVPAAKSVYKVGETLNITGMVVTGTYTDSLTEILPVTTANITGFNSAAVTGSQMLTISYAGKTTSYTVSVINADQTAPAGLGWTDESVKGRSDGSINNVTAAMEYKPSAAADTDWTPVAGSVIANLSPGSYDVRKAAKTNYNASPAVTVTIISGVSNTFTLTVNAPVFDDTVYNDPRPAAKEISIKSSGNTDASIASITVSSDSFTIGGSGTTVPYGQTITTWTIQPGDNLSAGTHTGTITVTYNNGMTATADAVIITAKADKPAPAGVGHVNESVNGRNDGSMTGLSAGMEYKLASDISWIPVTGTEITGLTPAAYTVRYEENNNYLASTPVLIVISTGAPNTYTLTAADLIFTAITYGDGQPAARAIHITNIGNTDASIVKISSDNTIFTIAGYGTTVPYGQTITSWTIQPRENLPAGIHTASITVTYNNGAAAAVPVSIEVLPHIEVLAPQVAPDAPMTILQGEENDIIKAVLTESDNGKFDEGSNITICLKITKGNIPQTDKDIAMAVQGGSTLAEFLDISLVKTVDGVETKITRTQSPIRITVEMPVEMRKTDRVFAIVRIHNGQAIVLTDLDTDPNTITFETDRFSTYITAYTDAVVIPVKTADPTAAAAVTPAKTADPTAAAAGRTGEESPLVPLNALGAAALVMALLINKKRRQRVPTDKMNRN